MTRQLDLSHRRLNRLVSKQKTILIRDQSVLAKCVCVCVCARARVCLCVCVRLRACVCLCVCKRLARGRLEVLSENFCLSFTVAR